MTRHAAGRPAAAPASVVTGLAPTDNVVLTGAGPGHPLRANQRRFLTSWAKSS